MNIGLVLDVTPREFIPKNINFAYTYWPEVGIYFLAILASDWNNFLKYGLRLEIFFGFLA
jgi:hypothetical protein